MWLRTDYFWRGWRRSRLRSERGTPDYCYAGLRAQRQVKPFKIRARDLKLKPGYSLDKPWDLIEEIEGPGYK